MTGALRKKDFARHRRSKCLEVTVGTRRISGLPPSPGVHGVGKNKQPLNRRRCLQIKAGELHGA